MRHAMYDGALPGRAGWDEERTGPGIAVLVDEAHLIRATRGTTATLGAQVERHGVDDRVVGGRGAVAGAVVTLVRADRGHLECRAPRRRERQHRSDAGITLVCTGIHVDAPVATIER